MGVLDNKIDLARENEKLRNKIIKLERELNIEKAKLHNQLLPFKSEYDTLFEDAPLPFQMLDEFGKIINVNQAWLTLLGYEFAEVVDTSIENYLTLESIKLLQTRFPQFLECGQIKSVIFELITKSGEVLQVEVNGRIKHDSNGKFKSTQCLLYDVTAKKKAEVLTLQQNEELIALRKQSEENAEKYRLILENQIGMVVKVDSQNRFLYVSPSYCSVFGKTEEELLGNSFMPLVHEDDREKTAELMTRLTTPPYSCLIEQRAMTVNGWRWFSWSDQAIVDEKNNIISVIGVGHDITDRKLLKESLNKSLVRNGALLSAIPDLMFVINDEGKVIDFKGDKYEHYFPNPTFLINKNVAEILPRNIVHSITKNINEVLGTFQSIKSTYTFDVEGEKRYFEARFIYYDRNEVLTIVRDFTDLKNAELELTQSKQLLKNVLDTIPIRVFWKNESLKYIGCNRAFLEDTGFEKLDDIVGKSDYDMVWKEQADFFRSIDREVIKSGIPQIGFEEVQDSLIGERQWLRTSKLPLKDENDLIYGVLGLYENITQQKQTELVRKIQYKISNALVTSSSLGDLLEILSVEIKKIVNCDNFYVAEYTQNTDMLKLIHFKDEIDNIEQWSAKDSLSGRVVKEGRAMLLSRIEIDQLSEQTEIEYIGKKAKSWLGIPLFFEGKIHGVMVMQSYTKHNAYSERDKELLEQIAHQVSIFINHKRSVENAMRLLIGIEQSPVNTFITDCNGHIEYVNRSFCETTGYTPEEVIGQTPSLLKSYKHNPELYDNLWQTIMKGEGWTGELYNKKKSGEYYWSNNVISPLINDNNEITNFIAVSEDITVQKRITEELILAKERAEESDRLKSAFIANISHEIRTPMNAILGFSELLRDRVVTPQKSKDYLSLINKSARHLLLLINDIIEISRIETNQILPYYKEINVTDCITNLMNTVGITIPPSKDLKIKLLHTDVNVSTQIITDELKFSQIIINLLTNAVKYTEKGVITVAYTIDEKEFNFVVTDTGIGIDKKYHELIFNRFNRLESKLSTKAGGSGLGLAIAKAYVELLGGTISVVSEVGVGSTFTFTIPLKAESEIELTKDRKRN